MRTTRWIWGIVCFAGGILALVLASQENATYSDAGGSGGPLMLVVIGSAIAVWLIGVAIIHFAAWIYGRARQD